MKQLLANDLVLREDNCNLSCKYCLTGQSQFKEEHKQQLIFQPPRPATYSPQTPLGQRLDQVIAATTDLDLPIIKITGGELFLVRGIMKFLSHLATHFATVVIQTNGVLLDAETLAEIKSWGNACLQISLDAVSYEGNSYRSETPALHASIMKRIYRALDSGIPTEIYCVLHDRSLPALEELLAAMMKYEEHVTVHPFPVRGQDSAEFFVKPDQVDHLRRILSLYDKYAAVLPPRAYLDRLLRFFQEGERTFRCHLPRFAFTTFDDGILTSCPNIWFNQVGNLLQEGSEAVTSRIGTTPFYQILLAEKPRIKACKGCFTPWDLLSMYIDREITIDELCRTPMYSAPASRMRIEAIAQDYWGHKC